MALRPTVPEQHDSCCMRMSGNYIKFQISKMKYFVCLSLLLCTLIRIIGAQTGQKKSSETPHLEGVGELIKYVLFSKKLRGPYA